MSDLINLASLRRHIAERRQVISEKWPKNLPPDEYQKNIGRHEELEAFAAVVQDAVRQANAAGLEDDDDDETDKA